MSVESSHEPLQVGEWRVEPALDQLSRDGEFVKLEPRTMRLLLRLCAQPGRVVSSRQLLDDVWAGVVVGPASVYQAISQLRKLLADSDPQPSYIATVPRKGYRLIAPVRRAANESAVLCADSNDAARVSNRTTQLHRWIAAIVLISIGVCAFALWLRSPQPSARQSASAESALIELSDARRADICAGATESLSSILSTDIVSSLSRNANTETDETGAPRRTSATQSTFSARSSHPDIE
jgi:transcriptional activator of cad operon